MTCPPPFGGFSLRVRDDILLGISSHPPAPDLSAFSKEKGVTWIANFFFFEK